MELAKVSHRILLVNPVRSIALLAEAALKVMVDLCKEAVICLAEFEPITMTMVCVFDLGKIKSSNECV